MSNLNEIGNFDMVFINNDDKTKKSLQSINRSSIQQYKLSLTRPSNGLSSAILDDIWDEHCALVDDQSPQAVDNFSGPVGLLLQSAHMTRGTRTWKSGLRNIESPVALINKDPALCKKNPKCNYKDSKLEGLDIFVNNTYSSEYMKRANESFKDIKTNCTSDRICTTETMAKSGFSYDRDLSSKKPVGRFLQPQTNAVQRPMTYPVVSKNVYQEKQNAQGAGRNRNLIMDEENNGAETIQKSVFKSAREQLVLSNPSMKRSLGTARKVPSKFVSPMVSENKKSEEEPEVADERLKHIDPKMVELIESEIMDRGVPIGWDEIAGLQMAKSVIQEAVVWPLLRPDIFTGLRRPPRGILLFGPPGTGKTLIGKCVASQCRATFFNISASSLTSKWIGDGEKMVRALFAVATCHQPAVIFIDEIDSLLTQRSDAEHEATRRIKTEFLVQFDGAGTGEEERLLIIGATNRPQELDEAARRRLVKRLYIPLPEIDARKQIIINLLKNERNSLQESEIDEVCSLTDGYSGADMRSLCSEAAMGPIRSVPMSQMINIETDKVRPVSIEDFKNALQRVRPSVSQDDLGQYVKWNNTYGSGL